jgi:hypothetical protein
MAVLQTRIFTSHTEPDDWAETLIGRALRPLTADYHDHLEWFWFSRYVCATGMAGEDTGDCEINAIPEPFKAVLPGINQRGHRSLRFRFEIADGQRNNFEGRLRQLVADYGYAISDVRPYDEVADTGGPRFLGAENRLPAGAQIRARCVTLIYYATSQLLFDMLVGPDPNGRYRIEQNELREQNPNGSALESVHHVFCNMTAIPLSVLISRQAGQQHLHGTYWGQPRGARDIQLGGQPFTEVYLAY